MKWGLRDRTSGPAVIHYDPNSGRVWRSEYWRQGQRLQRKCIAPNLR
jgi:hypothetical protein